jgi:uncharacterized protein (DUF1684 family)
MRRLLLGLLALCLSAGAGAAPAADYAAEIEAWRSERVARLTAPDGWLSLTGLHFLAEGESTLGRAAGNAVVLAGGPELLGRVTLAADGVVTLATAWDVEVTVDGQPVRSVVLGDGVRGRVIVAQCGTMSLHVIDRGGKKALRVKDTESARRRDFAGIEYFPIDPAWRIEADWVPYARPREVPITNIVGQVSNALVLGEAVFTRDGHTLRLLPLQEAPDEPLFFIISDLTSGEETYGAARFVYADPPRDGKVVIDFNRALNPPCAFTPFATCPLPPKENQLPVRVTAGEKNYRGEHP